MKLLLTVQNATSIETDLQFVKHFDGLVGGTEAAINQKLRGALEPLFDELRGPNHRVVVLSAQTMMNFAVDVCYSLGLAH